MIFKFWHNIYCNNIMLNLAELVSKTNQMLGFEENEDVKEVEGFEGFFIGFGGILTFAIWIFAIYLHLKCRGAGKNIPVGNNLSVGWGIIPAVFLTPLYLIWYLILIILKKTNC